MLADTEFNFAYLYYPLFCVMIDRLSESNVQSIGNQIEDMYRSHSRAYLSESLTSIILQSCISPSLLPDRLVMEQAMLLAILHGNVGSEVGMWVCGFCR